jgi:hypothetical protein
MRLSIAVFVMLITGTGALAQSRDFSGPFTGYEAEALSNVWSEIRAAARFEDINWRAHGLSGPPGDPEAQRLLSANWNELRRETRFEDIDWDDYSYGERSARSSERYGRSDRGYSANGRRYNDSPFTRAEAEDLSRVWDQIRVAAHFEDINWSAHGLSRAPGSAEAQRILSANWNELRRETRFEDIDWQDYSYADRSTPSSRTERYGRVGSGFPETERDFNESPFTREEAAALSRVWGEIRGAAHFEDINWRAHGLSGPPGDRDARRLMSTYWGELREAARFEDIDWQATTGYRAR